MEPSTFRGRDTEHWLSARLSGDDDTRWEAIDAIRHLCGPDTSVPLLLDTLLNDHYGRARGLAAHALYDLAVDSAEEVNWAEIMPRLQIAANDPDEGVREQIAELFDALENPPDLHG
jgi:hypothetical protein